MPVHGYKPIGSPTKYVQSATANSINQRATVPGKMLENGWAYSMGAHVGRADATIPNFAYGIWSGSNPTTLLGRTDAFQTGTYMLHAGDGTTYTQDLQTAVPLSAGSFYSLGFVGAGAIFGYGMLHPSEINLPAETGYHRDEYRRSVSTATPQDPFGASSSGDDFGWIAIWVNYETNVKPDRPLHVDTSPTAGATLSTTTPTFSGLFKDDNKVLPNGLPGDSLKKYQIKVSHFVNTVEIVDWNATFTATPAEALNAAWSQVYGGATLQAGTIYTWSTRVQDQHNAWSDWMIEKTFSVSAGQISNMTGPNGVQQTKSPGPFLGRWTDPTGGILDRVKIEIVDEASGSVSRTSPAWIDIANVSNNGNISVPWASTGFAELQAGGSYSYRMKGLTTTNIESAWSVRGLFSINAAPSIPLIFQPNDDATTSSRPIIYVAATDTDDTIGTGWQVFLRIKDSNGTVLFTRSMVYQGDNLWTYQITSTDWPSAGAYNVDAYAFDGSFYSSGKTTLDATAIGPEVTINFTAGPAIIIGSPAHGSSVNGTRPLINWDFTNQIRYRVRIWEEAPVGEGELVYDSGEITDSVTQHRVASGYITDNTTYTYVIDAWNNLNQQGTSVPITFFTDFSEADELNNFRVSPHRSRGDITPTAILISWDKTGYTNAEFEEYILTIRADTDTVFDVDDEIKATNRRIFRITSPTVTTAVYYLPASGVSYTIGLSQIVTITDPQGNGDVTIRSPIQREEITVNFKETVICDANHGGARRIVLRYRTNRSITRNREQKTVRPFGARAPTVIRTKRFNRTIEGDFYVVSDSLTTEERNADIQTKMLEIDKLDYYGGPLCYRDGRGRRYFGEITNWQEDDPQGGRPREVSITFEQTNATESPDV